MADKNNEKKKQPTGQTVARNIARYRKLFKYSLQDVVNKLNEYGIKSNASTVNRHEKGLSKISVDDLMAYSHVFDIIPNALLQPEYPENNEVQLTSYEPCTSRKAYMYLEGRSVMEVPEHMTPEIATKRQRQLSNPRTLLELEKTDNVEKAIIDKITKLQLANADFRLSRLTLDQDLAENNISAQPNISEVSDTKQLELYTYNAKEQIKNSQYRISRVQQIIENLAAPDTKTEKAISEFVEVELKLQEQLSEKAAIKTHDGYGYEYGLKVFPDGEMLQSIKYDNLIQPSEAKKETVATEQLKIYDRHLRQINLMLKKIDPTNQQETTNLYLYTKRISTAWETFTKMAYRDITAAIAGSYSWEIRYTEDKISLLESEIKQIKAENNQPIEWTNPKYQKRNLKQYPLKDLPKIWIEE